MCKCRAVGAGQLAYPVMPAQAWCGAPVLPVTHLPVISLNNYCSALVCFGSTMQCPVSCGLPFKSCCSAGYRMFDMQTSKFEVLPYTCPISQFSRLFCSLVSDDASHRAHPYRTKDDNLRPATNSDHLCQSPFVSLSSPAYIAQLASLAPV